MHGRETDAISNQSDANIWNSLSHINYISGMQDNLVKKKKKSIGLDKAWSHKVNERLNLAHRCFCRVR